MRRLLACAALVTVAVAMMAAPADAGKPTKTGGEPFEAVFRSRTSAISSSRRRCGVRRT